MCKFSLSLVIEYCFAIDVLFPSGEDTILAGRRPVFSTNADYSFVVWEVKSKVSIKFQSIFALDPRSSDHYVKSNQKDISKMTQLKAVEVSNMSHQKEIEYGVSVYQNTRDNFLVFVVWDLKLLINVRKATTDEEEDFIDSFFFKFDDTFRMKRLEQMSRLDPLVGDDLEKAVSEYHSLTDQIFVALKAKMYRRRLTTFTINH